MSESKKRSEPINGFRGLRPVDLARAAGLSAQIVRNYEAQGVIALALRTSSGHRAYNREHLVPAPRLPYREPCPDDSTDGSMCRSDQTTPYLARTRRLTSSRSICPST